MTSIAVEPIRGLLGPHRTFFVTPMTFCIGIKVREGIVALADSRIVVGTAQASKRKLTAIDHPDGTLFTMTSGLRSVRDKTLTYLAEAVQKQTEPSTQVYQVANQFGNQLRRVRAEDEPSLISGGLSFNSHAIIGGRLSGDGEPQLYYVYPEGNWIESNVDLPYFIIGRTPYGKPILDRLLRYDTPLRQAIALALLAFDATRTSVTDVDGPIDVAVLAGNNEKLTFRRFADSDFAESTDWWSRTLQEALSAMPHRWIDGMFK
jgi:putative proteasome-type protease